MVALSAAHGYAQISGRAQAVLVHVDCGTQSLGGAVHNAAKGRVPVLIFAGMSPATQEGELPGSRNEFIQWIQDVPRPARHRPRLCELRQRDPHRRERQADRPSRAAGLPHSDPQGPVYVVGGREVIEAETARVDIRRSIGRRVDAAAAAADAARSIAERARSTRGGRWS